MNDLDFKEKVAPEISDRWSGRITPAMLSDWHYHIRTFTVKESIEHIRKYFSQYDGRGNPRPADFGSWLKKNQVRTEQRSKVQRFDIKASWWPEVTAFKAVFANDKRIRFGWIERKDYAERGYIWIRRGGHWYLECFKPNEIKGAIISMVPIGTAPDSWTKIASSEAPEGLEELLAKEEGHAKAW